LLNTGIYYDSLFIDHSNILELLVKDFEWFLVQSLAGL
jgi:hypothetical protein